MSKVGASKKTVSKNHKKEKKGVKSKPVEPHSPSWEETTEKKGARKKVQRWSRKANQSRN